MRTLVIDCATEACSVALFDGDNLLAGECHMLGRGHAEALVPMIAALPGKGRAERIAAARGPGSFTGVRVGLAAARALALAWDSQLVGYATPALIAAIAREEAGSRPVTIATTGGHGEWFVQNFSAEGAALDDLLSLDPDQAVAGAASELIAGSQAEALVARRGHGMALNLWPDARRFPLLPLPAVGREIAPLYGRPPDARLPAVRE